MKRILSGALVLALLVAICLTGCAKTPTSSAAPASSAAGTSSAAESKAESLKPAKIQVWLLGPGKQTDSEKVWAKVNEMLAETLPNTTVEMSVLSSAEYKDKYNTMLAAQEPVDLAWGGYATNLKQDMLDGNLTELTDLLNKYGQDIKAGIGDTLMDMNTFDGKVYYLINWQSVYRDRLGIYLPTEFVNLMDGNWLDDTNKVTAKAVNDPTLDNIQAVYDQFAPYFQKLVDTDKIYGGMDLSTFQKDQLFQVGGRAMTQTNIGIQYGDDTFTVKSMIDTDVFRLYAKNMEDYYKKGYIASDIASKTINGWTNTTDGSYDSNSPVALGREAYGDDSEKQYSATFYREVSLVRTHDIGTIAGGSETCMTIPYCADEPERAMMFLNEIWKNKELYQLLIYGIKGEHYTDNGDGTITTGYGQIGNAAAKYGLWKWTIGTCMNSLVTEGDVAGYYQELQEREKNAYVSPFAKFNFDKADVESIISALDAVDKKYQGVKDGYSGNWEKGLESWIAERKAAGEDELIAEYQKQVNEFIKANNITTWNYKNQ